MRCSGAHCARTLLDEVQRCTLRSGADEEDWCDLAKRIGETLGEEDWRGAWRRGLAKHLAKTVDEEEEDKEDKEEKR